MFSPQQQQQQQRVAIIESTFCLFAYFTSFANVSNSKHSLATRVRLLAKHKILSDCFTVTTSSAFSRVV